MPFTTLALDRLIEPKASKPVATEKHVSESRHGSRVNGTDKQPDLKNSRKTIDRNHHWTQISPALYATPDPTPFPELTDSLSSFTSSPYIVNHKRRGPCLSKAFSDGNIALADEKAIEIVRSFEAEDVESCRVFNGIDNVREAVEDARAKFLVNRELENENVSNDAAVVQDNLKSFMLEQDSKMDDFFDPQDSSSVKSITDEENSYGLDVRSVNLNTSVSEFYDAWEELSSESGSQPPQIDIETELRETRISLLAEMEKRKQAEDHINEMKSQWRKICQQLSLVGLNLPEDSTALDDQSADDPLKELSRQIYLIRFVSNSIGRGVAKAELGSEIEAQLESKNFEIARLLDRLRYYEAVNHEMSQRNQETVETMRRVRQRRKRRQRWTWGSVVAAITVGSAALAWSTGKGSSSTDPPTSHTSDLSRSSQ